jgi:acyl-CoA synthetase (AMP-forming)/AMP-acid ligase II
VRLIDDSGAPVPWGEIGELVLRGPNVTIGYWAGPGAIEDAPKDGWFRTAGFVQMERGTRGIILNEILAGVAALLADYKVPESLEMIDLIPRNSLGKIDRKSLLAMISKPEGNDADQVARV